MKNNHINLKGVKEIDQKAIIEFTEEVRKKFPEAKFILYGSKVLSQDTKFSDIDMLVLLNRKVDTKIEEKIFDIGFEVGLKFNVVFGIVVEEITFWNSKLAKEMPFYTNIAKDGIKL